MEPMNIYGGSWVSESGIEVLENIFESELKDFFVDLETKPVDELKDFVEKYEKSDEKDFGIFYVDYLKTYLKDRIEKDMISRIKNFHDLSDELKNKLGGKSIEEVYSNPKVSTDEEKKLSIQGAFSGILIGCIREMLWKRSPTIVSEKLGFIEKGFLDFKIVFTVLEKNGYKYGDIDLSKELKGVTIDKDNFESFVEKLDSNDVMGEKFRECAKKIEDDIEDHMEAFEEEVVKAAQNSSDFTTMFFKGEVMKELESKFKVDDEEK